MLGPLHGHQDRPRLIPDFVDRYGPWAVVTGAAMGLGAEFARDLSRRGLGVIAADIDGDAAEALAASLRASGGKAEAFAGDLTERSVREALLARAAELDVGLLLCNAGLSQVEPFVDIELEVHETTLAVNSGAMLGLTHPTARRLCERGRGGIILVSSNSAVVHSPWVAHYAATKAYALCLAEALHEELAPHGVDVLGALPGLTRTPGLMKSGPDTDAMGPLLAEPEVAAKRIVDGLGRGSRVYPNGWDRYGGEMIARLLPRQWVLSLTSSTIARYYPRLRGRIKRR